MSPTAEFLIDSAYQYAPCQQLSVFYVICLLICFRFWYHIYDQESSSLPSRSALTVKVIRDHTKTDLLTVSGETDGWENATALIGNQPGGYKVSKASCRL